MVVAAAAFVVDAVGPLAVGHHATGVEAVTVVVAVSSGLPAAEIAVVECEVIAVVVEAVGIVDAVVRSDVYLIATGEPEVEVGAIVIELVDAED